MWSDTHESNTHRRALKGSLLPTSTRRILQGSLLPTNSRVVDLSLNGDVRLPCRALKDGGFLTEKPAGSRLRDIEPLGVKIQYLTAYSRLHNRFHDY